jgi:Cys-rich four helix bundle protein (predicted Tat secretion target)
MNRRELVAVGAGLMAMSGTASAQQSGHPDHAELGPLFLKASECVKAGLVCIDHALHELAAGNTSLAACAHSVDQMLSMAGTLGKFAVHKAAHLPALAKVALAVCQDCEAECRKHADMHVQCKACAEACNACAAECKKVST